MAAPPAESSAMDDPSEGGSFRARHLVPFGLLEPNKPRHYREMMKVAWENRDESGFAWRILKDGVCDGCSLGPRGLKDDVISGTHLCLTRLRLLRLNTMGPIPDGVWEDGERLASMSNRELHRLGRLSYPLVRKAGDKAFRRISWDEAVGIAAKALDETSRRDPRRMGFFVTSRGLTNEPYYVVQKLSRALSSNNVDLCSRLCHAPSVNGLKETIGWGAPTCSLSDFIGTDLLILFGTDLANNQPVATKYMHYARKAGTRIVVINPVREPGLERYWIPSVTSSALFGTQLMDEFIQVNVGGDIAFITGLLKALDAFGLWDEDFTREKTVGAPELRDALRATPWDEIVTQSGVSRLQVESFAHEYGAARSAVLVYSMGLTQHAFGVDNVRAIVNLALARGNVGRPKTGIVPIRGHSGVQGGGEVGVDPHRFPGGGDITEESAQRLSKTWGVEVPAWRGLMTAQMMDAAHRGEMGVFYAVGGNLLDTMPDPPYVREALARVGLRIHQDIVFNTSMMVPAKEAVLILPAKTRYEQDGGGTSTSTERRVRFSPEIPGRRIGEARSEWEIPTLIGRAIPRIAHAFPFAGDTVAIRREIEETVPFYQGIASLAKAGDSFQWGGEQLGRDGFPKMPEGRARFSIVPIPKVAIPDGAFHLSTRRGKQFNSIVIDSKDRQMGRAGRDTVFVNAADAAALEVAANDRIEVRNDLGSFEGSVRIANLPRRHIQMYWPEANILIARHYDPVAGVPDYNAIVRVEKKAGP
ncbi:MAG: FdhF/YdeP family oxidoreductase [Thermoplasmatota archaeon]